MAKQTKSVSWRFPKSHIAAIKILKQHGYSDNGDRTDIAALRKSIEEAWEREFPVTPLPSDEDLEQLL